MARGGARPGAGRKPKDGLAAKRPAKKKAFTAPTGEKSPDAPKDWPFGRATAAEPPKDAGPEAERDPESDDGLTDEQRAGLAPLEYLLAVMRSPKASKSARMTAAIQAAPYMHAKPAPVGKKEQRSADAKKPNRFAQAAPPKLVAAGGKKVG